MDTTMVTDQTSVPPAYRHHQRLVTPRDDVRLGEARLKWYDIRRPDVAVSDELVRESRAFLEAEVAEGRLALQADLGFVMLHIGDAQGVPSSVALLLVSTWRRANEVCESVFWKTLPDGRYEPAPAGAHPATFCVWELGAVWHERNAWVRYLESPRDAAAHGTWLADRFSGLV